MNIEVTSVKFDKKERVITITGQNLDGILEQMDFDTIPEEVTFKFDWGASAENFGAKRYLTKVLESQHKKQPDKTYSQILDELPGKIIFLHNNFIIK